MVASHSSPRLVAGTKARILYVNAQGSTSERNIDVIRVFTGRNGITYVRGFCHLRREERTFRTDRILALFNVSAGPAATAPVSAPVQPRVVIRTPPPVREKISEARSGSVVGTRYSPSPVADPPAVPAGVRIRRAVRFVFVCGLALCGVWVLTRAGEHQQDRTATPLPPAAVNAAVIAPVTPAPPPAVASEGRYRGQRFRSERIGGSMRFTILESGEVFSSEHRMRIRINEKLFEVRTGIRNEALFSLYAGVDANGDGEVSWDEVSEFQETLTGRYVYRANAVALRPDEFIAAGGGDCEDWALMTAGMLRFWGIPVYVCSLGGADWAHAVAVVPTDHLPRGAKTIDVPEGGPLRPGRYVPIDYEHVGRLSSAVQSGYHLNWIREPEEIYGWQI